MSKFSIIPNGGGTARYSGCPTFSGTYMKPGMLEFREIASPTAIPWTVGDYVQYTRTGFTYRLYTVPQVKKQARPTEYGGAFVYQSVQFFDDSKQLEICPFRDLVPDDNRIHFSTQPSISTYEAVDGIARRIQACLDDMYPNTWTVQVATVAMGASSDLVELMSEAREFTVSGVSLLGALDKVYEVWPDVGWTFTVDSVTGKNVLTIGGAGLNQAEGYQYGKGNGLKSITRVVANSEEMATRIFAYGSSRNMLPRWYNSQTIKDAESVDIQNLMLPIDAIVSMGYDGWGKTNVSGTDLPDPAKAFIDADGTTMARIGLRPKTYYFDGSGDLPDIYPSVREMTIKDVRQTKSSSSDPYYPSTTIYTDEDARVDEVLSVSTVFDDGLAGEEGKSASISSSESLGAMSGTGTVSASSTERIVLLAQKSFTMTKTRRTDISLSVSGSGSVTTNGDIGKAYLLVSIQKGDGTNFTEIKSKMEDMTQDENGDFIFQSLLVSVPDADITIGDIIRVYISVYVQNPTDSGLSYSYSINPTYSFFAAFNRTKTFTISLRQIGFDINEQADLGDGKTIAMRSGKCAGRSFVIKSCAYVQSADSWNLEVIRSQDDSLSQWFPNTDYPIVAGDEFVLLDIAMPEEYVKVAEIRLLEAAQELLADVSVERWQYTPEIDAKFMVENSRVLLPAQIISLTDTDIIGNSAESILIDSVTINEGEAIIPTYKVTLRDRKKKTFTDAKGADSMTSNPVTNSTEETIQQIAKQSGDSFFELDASGNVTLKSQYENLWVPGFLTGGGTNGSNGGGGGGGGLISSVYEKTSLGSVYSASGTEDLTKTFSAYAIDYIYQTVQSLSTAIAGVNVLDSITTTQDGTVDFTWHNGDVVKVDLNHSHSGYVPITRTINGHALSDNITLSATTDLGVASWAIGGSGSGSTIPFSILPSLYVARTQVSDSAANKVLYGVDAISYNTSSTSASSDDSRIAWTAGSGGATGTWGLNGNLSVTGATTISGGATISANSEYALTVNSTYSNSYTYIRIQKNGANKTLIGYGNGLSYIANNETYARIGVNDSGVPQYWASYNTPAADRKTLWHSGNSNLTTVDWSAKAVTAADAITLSGDTAAKRRIYFGDSTHYVELDSNGFHFSHGVYSDSWMSAGGVGSGGSGSVSYLNDLTDVTAPSPSTGNFLYWNGSAWVDTALKTVGGTSLIGSGNISVGGTLSPATASALGGILVGSVITTPTIQTISSVADRYYYIQCDSTGLAFVNVPWSGGGGGTSTVSWGTESGNTVPLTVDGTTKNLLMSGALADYALNTGDSSYNFLVNTLKFSSGTLGCDTTVLPRPKWTYTDSISQQTPTTVTKTLAYKDEIPTELKCPAKARFYDGTTYTDYDGSQKKIIVASTVGAVSIAGADTITGAKTFSTNNVTLSGVNLLPSTNNSCSVGSSSARFATYYGVTGNLSGALTLSGSTNATRRICFGDADHYLELDSNGFHFSHGVYTDGFLSGGGFGPGTFTPIVLLDDESEMPASPDSGTLYLIKE